MKLPEADALLFFKLMWRLYFYVNREQELVPGLETPESVFELPQSEVAELREALWNDRRVIDAYVTENPHELPEEELALVAKWKRAVTGTFYIERFLKRHAIFIASDSQVYAVHALHERLESVLPRLPLPVMTEAVLLPFKGKIVYDGLLAIRNVTFGGGIRRNMRETYMAAKQAGKLVETLEPEEATQPKRQRLEKPRADWKPLLDELLRKAGRLKGGTPFEQAAFGLLRASARLARSVVDEPEDSNAFDGAERSLRRAITRWRTTKERSEWY